MNKNNKKQTTTKQKIYIQHSKKPKQHTAIENLAMIAKAKHMDLSNFADCVRDCNYDKKLIKELYSLYLARDIYSEYDLRCRIDEEVTRAVARQLSKYGLKGITEEHLDDLADRIWFKNFFGHERDN